MEVINESSAILSNYEVLTLLKDIQAGRGQKKPTKGLQQLATITYEAVKYLGDKPCIDQNDQIISDMMTDLAPYNLTKAEKLQLVNLCPTTAVEIQLIVEESEERLTEEQIYELLNVIAKYRPECEQDKDDGDMETEETALVTEEAVE